MNCVALPLNQERVHRESSGLIESHTCEYKRRKFVKRQLYLAVIRGFSAGIMPG